MINVLAQLNIQFFHNYYAYYILPFIFLLFLGEVALSHYRKKLKISYTSPLNLERLETPRSSLFKNTKIVGWAFIWILCCITLMDPYGNVSYFKPSSSEKTNAAPSNLADEIIFLVDTSASMGVPDLSEGQTRLEMAKAIIKDILEGLRGQSAALYAFTSELELISPPTLDYLFLRLETRDLHIDQDGVGGTQFLPVLTALKTQAFPQSISKRYSVILFSDGGDNQLETLKGTELLKAKNKILNALSNPQQEHLRLYTIGLGSKKASLVPHVTFDDKAVFSKLESEILEELAKKERGLYIEADSHSSLELAQEILEKIDENATDRNGAQVLKQVAVVHPQDFIVDLYFQFPLGVALLFFILNFILPDVRHL